MKNYGGLLITLLSGGIKQSADEIRGLGIQGKSKTANHLQIHNNFKISSDREYGKDLFRSLSIVNGIEKSQVINQLEKDAKRVEENRRKALSTPRIRSNAGFPPFPLFSTEQTSLHPLFHERLEKESADCPVYKRVT